MNPLVLAIIGYALLSLQEKKEPGGTFATRKSLAHDVTPTPVPDWGLVARQKTPATQEAQKVELTLEGAWAYGWIWAYFASMGGADGVFQRTLLKQYLLKHNFTLHDVTAFASNALATYASVRTLTGSIPGISDAIGAAAGLLSGFVDFVAKGASREAEIEDLFLVWKDFFYGPLGRPPTSLFHFMQYYGQRGDLKGTELDPSLVGDLGNPDSPAIMLHVRLLTAWQIITSNYKTPKTPKYLTIYGDGKTDYDGQKNKGLNLWAGSQALPFSYFFYAFDPNAMFQYSDNPGSWGRYAKIMGRKDKLNAFTFTSADFDQVFPKGMARWTLEVDPTKYTSSKISLAPQDRQRVVHATKNDWFESRWTP